MRGKMLGLNGEGAGIVGGCRISQADFVARRVGWLDVSCGMMLAASTCYQR